MLEDHQDDAVLKHTYDKSGRRIASELPNGTVLRYEFEAGTALKALFLDGLALARVQRDDHGREIERQLGPQLKTETNYDPQGRLQRHRTLKYTGTQADSHIRPALLVSRNYQYNTQGQISRIDDSRRGSTHYHYDTIDRLVRVEGPNPETFVHDPAGNLLAHNDSETNNNAAITRGNRLAFHGDNHYQYDAQGNRVAQRRGKDRKLETTYEYDAQNQLSAINVEGEETRYAYDPLGRRISKEKAHSRTEFLWLGDVLLSETTNDQTRTYIFEPYSFKPLAFIDQELNHQQLYYYHLDHLGTPQEISDYQGNIVWSGSYKAYGNLAVAQENAVENNLRFQGQYFDEESGLHYNRFRYYDPQVGRFINQDPIGLLGGTNNYRYVPNPISWIDPWGLSAKDCEADSLYRGVSAKHPALDEAREGVVRPAKPDANLTPEQHARGGLTGESQYVSWTQNKDLALEHAAKEGPGGLLLSVPKGAPQATDAWAWGWTHMNEWGEVEMLQTGTRTGINVTEALPK